MALALAGRRFDKLEAVPRIPGAAVISIMTMPVVYRSDAMARVLEQARKVAQSNAAVLVTGESGSGKEIIARAIHCYSARAASAWIDVNCAALPDHLVESELFGYDKGAFSGAENAKQGLLELAQGGTLLLDEIGELDPKLQVKLLRVLDGAPYYRLGGTRKIPVDVRFVAATNHELEEAAEAGTFRHDLYHRLSQIRIHMPALRDRPEDIEPLARYFLARENPRLAFSPAALRLLSQYHWPGNVRQLRNVVTAAAVFAENREIQVADLPEGVRAALHSAPGSAPEFALGPRISDLEREAIFRALRQTGGRQAPAADMLGISRRTLIRKLKQYAPLQKAAAAPTEELVTCD